jgi:hypothetical protein
MHSQPLASRHYRQLKNNHFLVRTLKIEKENFIPRDENQTREREEAIKSGKNSFL